MIALGQRYYATSNGIRVTWDHSRLGHSDFETNDQRCFLCGIPFTAGENVYSSHDFASRRPVLVCSAVHALWATAQCCKPYRAPLDLPEQLIELAPACELCDEEAIDMIINDAGSRYPFCAEHADPVTELAQSAGARLGRWSE